MNIENLRKMKATLLATLLTVSLANTSNTNAQAIDEETIVIDEMDLSKYDVVEFHKLKGVYTMLVDNKPLYVYLNNNYKNDFLPKSDALAIARENYNTNNVYFQSKVIQSPYYVEGETPEEERYNSVFAISKEEKVEGWTNVKDANIPADCLVATTLEMGDFMLSEANLTKYKENMNGFALMDIKNDGVTDVVFLGNNEYNGLINKKEAAALMSADKNIKLYGKQVIEKDKVKTIYALNNTNPGNGWTQKSLSEINTDTNVIGSNTLYMDALFFITYTNFKEIETEKIYIPKSVDNTLENNTNKSMDCLPKAEAISYADNKFIGLQYCILQRTISLQNGEQQTIYAISLEGEVDGWTFAFDDKIPENANIFLTLTDACNYIDAYGKNLSLGL